MNRSILIVICDFLLVSLLAFSNVDVNNIAREGKTQAFGMQTVATNPPSAGNDLTAVMKLALEEEQKQREQLRAELTQTRQQIGEREARVQNLQRQVQQHEEQAQQLQQQQQALEQQFTAAQTNIQALNQRLRSASTETLLTKEQLAAMEAEAKKRAEDAAALQAQLENLSRSNQMVLNERQQLSTQLQVAEVERRHATQQVALMAEQVKAEREEKAKLFEGVKALATNSVQLAQEIRENRPLAPNTIFNDFVSNRVEARINASRSGFFGNESTKRRDTETVLVTDGTNNYALCHVQDTPLTLWSPGTDWEGLTGTLGHHLAQVPIQWLAFSSQDPRIVWMPVSADDARTLGCKIYRTTSDPYKFQDAVLVGSDGSYYGECKFQMDLSTPQYVKLDNSFIKGLFGKFNPSRGDLVFSKTGELLGIMANNTYCFVARDFHPGATIRFGSDVRAQRTGELLSSLYAQVFQMPAKLQ
jgi:membrane protein involved in colicin uptake